MKLKTPRHVLVPAGALLLAALCSPPLRAEEGGYVPDLDAVAVSSASELRDAVSRYSLDRWTLFRRFGRDPTPARRAAMRAFYEEWRAALDAMDFDALGVEGGIDWVLLSNRIAYELRRLDREEKLAAEVAPLLPFADTVVDLEEARARMENVDPRTAAATLDALTETIGETRQAVERGLEPAAEDSAGEARIETTKTLAHRAAKAAEGLRQKLAEWHGHFDGYDPLFTWWTKAPYAKAEEALDAYVDFLRQRVVGVSEGEDAPIVGDPIGRGALVEDLALEMIVYAPEELVAIGRRELAWCEAEMSKAARELGYGDDWKAALEHVKTLHVEPGEQPELIREQGREVVAFLEERDLLTIPRLAEDVWQIFMISPEKQKVNPFFFYNRDAIWVSFPTAEMSHEEKLMSMRGNNVHFSRATVHHELIPGHHLQGFMTSRYNAHRQIFATPFWTEGWALYWEMVLWDLGFPQTPENQIGMLFWRMHRAARIIFSLCFHLGG